VKQDADSNILLKAPVEIWECLISVSLENPFAESEAIVMEAMSASGSLDRMSGAVGGRLPLNTISSLVDRGLVSLSLDGSVEVCKDAEQAIQDDGLVEFLRYSGSSKVKAVVVRDLLTGRFHDLGVLGEEGKGHKGPVLNPEAQKSSRSQMDLDSVNVAELIRPVAGRVAHELGSSSKTVLSSSRLLKVTSRSTEASVIYRWHRRQDGISLPTPLRESSLARRILEEGAVPELSAQADEDETKREWPASAELTSLESVDIASKMIRRVERGHAKVSKKHLRELVVNAANSLDELAEALATEDGVGRAGGASVVVGTEFEQWRAVQDVLKSAKSSCVLLSAFTWKGFSDDAASRINESLPEGCELLLLSGEPDRINEPEFARRTEEYGRALSDNGAPDNVRVEYTRRACHAKFAISDTGAVWLGSCNLLSAAPGSWVLESGLVFRDPALAKAVINHVLEDGWLSETDETHLKSIRDQLPQNAASQPIKTALEVVATVSSRLRTMLEESWFDPSEAKKEMDGLVPVLRGFAERPRWQLVRTDQHRPAMLSLIRSARKRIALGSDAIRKMGLDESTIVEVARRPGVVEDRASKYTVQVYWGRHDPSEIRNDNREEIEEARGRLKRLRDEIVKYDEGGQGLRAKFFPFKSGDPMMTHCKFIAVDDNRLLLTSDNILSFSDDEGFDSDARELGLLVDSPRLARMLRSEMELLVPDSRDWWDRGRWSGALAWALEESGRDEISLGEAMEVLLDRVDQSKILDDDWVGTIGNLCNTRGYDHSHAPYNIAREGSGDGVFEIRWKGSGEEPFDLSYNSPDFDLVHLGRVTSNWDVSGQRGDEPEAVDAREAPIATTGALKESTGTEAVDPEKFSAALIGAMSDSNSWEALATSYSKMVSSTPDLRVGKPAMFIERKCSDWVEMKRSDTGHPWIRRRH